MDQSTHQPLDDAFLDAAAADALGARGVEEADAFVQTLAKSDEPHRRVARDLRATVATLAAASPYMEPPPALRGQILAATADKSFKIEDYRRSGEMSPKLMRWGLIAATMFLAASAWYNTMIRSRLSAADEQFRHLQAMAQTEINSKNTAIGMLSDPKVRQVVIVDRGSNQPVGKLLINDASQQAMLVMPNKVLPAGAKAKIEIMEQGEKRELVADAIGAPAGPWQAVNLKLERPLQQPEAVKVNDGTYAAMGK